MARQNTDKLRGVVDIEFAGVEEQIGKLREQMKSLGAVLPKELQDADKEFDKLLKQAERIREALNEAGDAEEFGPLKKSMGEVASQAEQIGDALAKAQKGRGQIINVGHTQQATRELKRVKDGLKQVNVAQQRTTLMSQNMLRVIQDAPFGMLGMANNLQMLAENFSTARAKGFSFTETMGAGLKSLFAGPMAPAAVVAIATVIIQKWDEIEEAGRRLGDRLDGLTRSQRELNKAIREFESPEAWKKFVEGLDPDELKTTRDRLIELREAMIEADPTLARDPRSQVRREKAMGIIALISGKGMGQAESNAAEFIALLDQIAEVERRLFEARAEQARRASVGLSTEDQEKAEKQAEKDREAFEKRMIELIKWREKQAELQRQFDEIDAKAAEEARKEELQRQKEAQRRQLDQLRLHMKRIQQARSAVMGGVRAGDQQAAAIGVGVLPALGARASRGAQIERMQAEAFFERAQLDEKISVRQDALDELAELEKEASGKQLEQIRSDQERLIAEQKKLEAQRKQIAIDTQQEITEKRHQWRMQDLQSMQQIAGQMGQVFGNMATMFASEGEKGLEQHRGFLKAAAWADAIAAGIAVFRNVSQAGKGNPLVMVSAAAAMAGVITSLGAKIRQIDNPGGASTGAGITGGRFTALNNRIAANRAANFQQAQDRVNATGAAQRDSDMSQKLTQVAEAIQDQRVVIDQSTAADVARVGGKRNNKRVSFSG